MKHNTIQFSTVKNVVRKLEKYFLSYQRISPEEHHILTWLHPQLNPKSAEIVKKYISLWNKGVVCSLHLDRSQVAELIQALKANKIKHGYFEKPVARWTLALQRRYVELIKKHALPLKAKNSITAIELDELDYLSAERKRLGYVQSKREKMVEKKVTLWLKKEFNRSFGSIRVKPGSKVFRLLSKLSKASDIHQISDRLHKKNETVLFGQYGARVFCVSFGECLAAKELLNGHQTASSSHS